jgi:HAMP domain-containing protein
MQSRAEVPEDNGEVQKSQRMKSPKKAGSKGKRMGLRSKIFILFFFIPIILIITAGVLYLGQLNSLSLLISGESTRVVTNLAEQIIQDKARGVAAEVKLYLDNNRNLKRGQFYADEAFRAVAVQKVGKTGYTALHAIPDSDGVWRNWVHTNPKLVGFDMSKLKKPMGENFGGFWKVFSHGKAATESKGYYTWQDKDGAFREKYMVCTPVKGTDFVIAATTYLDEFTRPMIQLESRAQAMTSSTRSIVFSILGGTLLLIGLIVALYGQRLTGKIKSLTDLAERISVGEMDAEINIDSKDEIGDLAQAVSRMQDSIRLSIERLRRRRQSRTA